MVDLRIVGGLAVVAGVLIFLSIFPIFPFDLLSIFGPTSMQVGDIEEFSVSSVNTEESENTWIEDPCYNNGGVDTSRAPKITIQQELQQVGASGWKWTGGVVGYEYVISVEAVAASDSVTVAMQPYCRDGFLADTAEVMQVTVSSSSDGTTDDGMTDEPTTTEDSFVRRYKPTRVDVEGNKVTGTVFLENKGGDMPVTNIVEMQVRPKDAPVLSVVSGQKTCDPDHPENVHREYRLNSGDREAVELTVRDVPDGERTIYFVTATACADNGGVQTEPITPAKKYGTVRVGSDVPPTNDFWLWIGAALFGVLLIGAGVFLARG